MKIPEVHQIAKEMYPLDGPIRKLATVMAEVSLSVGPLTDNGFLIFLDAKNVTNGQGQWLSQRVEFPEKDFRDESEGRCRTLIASRVDEALGSMQLRMKNDGLVGIPTPEPETPKPVPEKVELPPVKSKRKAVKRKAKVKEPVPA